MGNSEFERHAAYETVQAVERRWKRAHDAECRQRKHKTLNNLFAILVLLAGLVGIVFFVIRHYGMEIPAMDGFDVKELAALVGAGQKTSKIETDRRDEYVRLLGSFRGKACVPWTNAPVEIKPKTAGAGVRYLVLCGRKGDSRLYEMVSDGRGSMSVKALSPLAKPIEVEMKDFRANVNGKPYFVLCNDVVYVINCNDGVVGRRLLNEML